MNLNGQWRTDMFGTFVGCPYSPSSQRRQRRIARRGLLLMLSSLSSAWLFPVSQLLRRHRAVPKRMQFDAQHHAGFV